MSSFSLGSAVCRTTSLDGASWYSGAGVARSYSGQFGRKSLDLGLCSRQRFVQILDTAFQILGLGFAGFQLFSKFVAFPGERSLRSKLSLELSD
ncbi:hypothetical protein HG530_000051 [Fusarium avenaceum]|nr:hypothetical protein HG530_000051 [Fusarium avenaceum]